MKKNVELLRAVAQKLRRLRHEKHYRQTTVIEQNECGTTACIGGWAAIMAPGAEFKLKKVEYNSCGIKGCSEPGHKSKVRVQPVLAYRGKVVDNKLGFAQRRLGISSRMADWLFSGAAYADWPAEYSARLTAGERPSRVAADLLDAIADGKVKPRDGRDTAW